MAEMLGMDVGSSRDQLATIRAWAGTIEGVERQLTLTRYMSADALSYGLMPGSLIVAPFSISTLASAQADLGNAADAVGYLLAKLEQEIQQQEQVSGSLYVTDAGWVVIPITARPPGHDETGATVLLGDVLFAFDLLTVPFTAVRQGAIAWNDAWKTWWRQVDQLKPPTWLTDFARDSGYLLKYGARFANLIPYVGAATSTATTALEWQENAEDGNDWGNVRNAIGTGLAYVEVATLAFPPASVVVAAVGLVWDVFDLVWDLGEDFVW